MPLGLGLLQQLDRVGTLKEGGVILDRHYEAIKKHVKSGSSVAKDRWDAIDAAWRLRQKGTFDEQEWTTQIDGEIQLIISSARPSSHQDASGARGAPVSGQTPAAAAAGCRRAVDRGKESREAAARGTLGGNIMNAFAIGSGEPVSLILLHTLLLVSVDLCRA